MLKSHYLFLFPYFTTAPQFQGHLTKRSSKALQRLCCYEGGDEVKQELEYKQLPVTESEGS